MKKKIVASLLLALVGTSMSHVARGQSRVPESDTQSWNDVQLTVPMTKKADFLLQTTWRFGDNFFGAVVDERWGAGFNYKLSRYVTLNELFLHRGARPPHGKSETEERLSFGATFQGPMGKFTLSDRNWFERRWREPQVDAWRYRNRVRLEHPFKVEKTKFVWFISDEVFYDWSAHDWVRNRAAIGAGHTFNKHVTGELYYLRQNDGRSRPGDINVIGTTLRFKL